MFNGGDAVNTNLTLNEFKMFCKLYQNIRQFDVFSVSESRWFGVYDNVHVMLSPPRIYFSGESGKAVFMYVERLCVETSANGVLKVAVYQHK